MDTSELPGPDSAGSDAWPGLARLAADATQVARVVGKIIGSGDDTRYDTAILRECLQDELGDLRAAIDYVIGKNALDWDAVNRRRDRTRSRYERWAAGHRAAPHDQDAAGNGRPAPRQCARPSRPAPDRSATTRPPGYRHGE